MGQNKAFLDYGHQSFIEALLEKFETYEERIIVANDVSLYNFENVTTIQDIYPNRGPLCGLYTGLKHMKGQRALVITVDTPLLTKDLLDYLYQYPIQGECLVPIVDGRWQSLCAVYKKSVLPSLKASVESGEKKVRVFLEKVRVETLEEEAFKAFGDPKKLFSNINTPEDYHRM
jgi:molybdopterin-guanine dinucleotide biosynthesis protein A